MKRIMSIALAAVIAFSVVPVSQVFAAMSEAFQVTHPTITEAQYNYGQQMINQAIPDQTKLKQGVFEVNLPMLNNGYVWSIDNGGQTLYFNQGGEKVSYNFNTSQIISIQLMLLPNHEVAITCYKVTNGSVTVENTEQISQRGKEIIDGINDNTSTPGTSPVRLQDIEGHWAKNYIDSAVSKGYINGYEDQTFRPENTITRAEFVTALVRALKLNASNKPASVFTDDNSWAEGYIQAAIERGLIKPEEYTDLKFEPEKKITRQEIAIMTIRALDKEKEATDQSWWAKLLNKLTDLLSIDEKWRGYVKIANDLGIVRGYEDGSFGPTKNATRAEAVVMVERTLEKLPR